ncbi:hypothetical protein OTB20_28875 [Streptomyces sp. H27-H1]|uniref:hypothetical protein n=1 Tax=Streptomyces sp. H27-H1 TaxID=2996461 RepID=UPI002271CBFF|nr:hypothetical protein [Streptomyces sp. H27-H1]MCY0930134.1 hypothetical protein [Streptomyces sp. H27-H1]
MAVLSTIVVVLGAWCAASVATAALYFALRRLHVRRQWAAAAVPGGAGAARSRGPGDRPLRTAHPSGRSGWGRRVPPPDLQAG